MMKRCLHRYLILLCLAAALVWLPASAHAGEGKVRRSPHAVKDEYIVVLKDDIPRADVAGIAKRLAHAHGGKVERVWEYALKGFFVRMTEGQAMGLSHDPDVAYIEENAEMFLSARQVTNVDPATCDLPTQTDCQTEDDDRLWHLDRIEQNLAVPSNNYGYCSDGTGVHVYVVDTGVWRGHSEFEDDPARVRDGYNASGDGDIDGDGEPDDDDYYPAWDPCHGPATLLPEDEGTSFGSYFNQVFVASHGTGVGSLVAGRKVGIAKNATIVPVKVARCGEFAARPLKRNLYYPAGQIVLANGTHYQVLTAGTTGSTTPTSWTSGPNSGCTPDGTACLRWIGNNLPQTVQMIIEGVDWILRPSNPYPKSPAVATFSTYRRVNDDGVTNPVPIPGRSTPISLEQVVRNLLATGISVVASANNQNGNACDTSPGRMSKDNPDPMSRGDVITVGGSMVVNNPDRLPAGFANPATGGVANATEPPYDPSRPTLDARWRCGPGDSAGCTQNGMANPPLPPVPPTEDAYYTSTAGSNGGPCVTLFAPAKNISVAQITGATAYRDRLAAEGWASGTSWSAPLVAGVAAQILQAHPTFTPAQVRDALLENALHGQLDPFQLDPPGVTGTPNILLHTGDVFIDNQPTVTLGTNGGPTTVTGTVRASTPVTYQWYLVNPEFNLAQHPRAAAASTPITSPSATTATLSVTPSVRTGYWVRITSDCATVDSDIAIVDPAPPAVPTNVIATASGGVVAVTWTPAAGADGYDVERKVAGAGWSVARTVLGGMQSSASDTPVSASGVVLYRVVARTGAGRSAPSNNDVAYVGTFTDDPVLATAPYTAVKAAHIIQLRRAVNGLREAIGLASVYGGADLDEAALRGQPIDDAHFTTLLSNLNAARTDPLAGLPAVAFRAVPAPGQLIRRTQIEDLRNGVK